MEINYNKNYITIDKNEKYIICKSFDVVNNFTLYICKKNKRLFKRLFNSIFEDHSEIIIRFKLGEYLHDEDILWDSDFIFENKIIFLKINNKFIKNKEEIRQHFEGLKTINMLTKNYEYDDWYPYDDYMTNYLNFTKKELEESNNNWK